MRLTDLAGFTLLADDEREVVVGATGRFWKMSPEVIPCDSTTFREAQPAGTARIAMNFLLIEDAESETQVSTQTRIQCADAETERSFGRYWRLIRPGSGLIRIAMLRALRREAEERTR